ncbi:hypothetical protein CFOL_v3_20840 [Cephalotus follicularis]|uniref:HhH-GPD domain-containing protein n=1 Tax=Cephalotus follicularis TaxID=3775 RepID=A0A1Q3CAU9_CEPFO|nr:hypothetical protein CFOL_v3_20840 [Cephalotus follicularis]
MGSWVLLEVPLGEAAVTFDIEKAVCSHGLFMMAPNHWDPLSKTLSRPLNLCLSPLSPPLHYHDGDTKENNVMVRVSHPPDSPLSLHVKVCCFSHSLTPQQKQQLLVVRMLRLTDNDERNVREYRKIVASISEQEQIRSDSLRSFSGRVFRSPTLFEDMVKCILLCNCQWSRTLSMAKALCELQAELQHQSSSLSVTESEGMNSSALKAETEKFIPNTPVRKDLERKLPVSKISKKSAETEKFIPKTPVRKDLERKLPVSKISKKLTTKFSQTKAELEVGVNLRVDSDITTILDSSPNFIQDHVEIDSEPFLASNELFTANSNSVSDLQSSGEREPYAYDRTGNFPSPRELAILDGTFLAKRCNLGYRASRIIKLAKGIVEGKIQLRHLEEVCKEANLSSYDKVAMQLSEIDGFGPFTCANVLMCMGYYHVIPTDSETIRHLKQVHGKSSTIQTIKRDVEIIYGKFAPFQFLGYWAEMWHFYEQRFGKLSVMPYSDYKLITSSNMRTKRSCKNKRTKMSQQ